MNMLILQPGDVPDACANVDDLAKDMGNEPKMTVKEGAKRFVEWYRGCYSS